MAIALDTSLDFTIVNPGTSISGSYTCTGSNLILFAGLFDTTGGSSVVTSVTYNSVGLTKIAEIQVSGDRWVTLWYLINPATGAHTLQGNASASTALKMLAVSYTGAAQSGQPDAFNTTTGTAILTASVTSIADNCWAVFVAKGSNATPTIDSGVTQRQAANGLFIGDNNGPKTPAGSITMSVNSNSSFGAGIVATFAPFTASAARTRLALLGVG